MSLIPNTTYYYRVKALNSSQESEYSEVIAVTTLPDDSLFQNVLPASNPQVARILTSSNKAEVYLELPFMNEGIQEYKVTLSTNSDFSTPLYSNLTYIINRNTNYAFLNQVRYVVLTLSNLNTDTIYYLRIRSVNKIGQSGNTDTSFTTTTPLPAPIALGTTNLTAITATINWTKVNGATSYVVDLDDNSNFSSPILNNLDVGDVSNYNVPVLIENTTYFYRVRAKVNTTLSKYSNTITFTTLDNTQTYNDLSFDLVNPSIIGVKNLYLDTFSIHWYPVEKANSYTLDLSTSINFSTFVVQNATTTETNYTFAGLTPDTVYYFRIKANNTAKSSTYTTFTVTTLRNNVNLSPPQLLTPSTVLSTAFILTWVKRNYATRYRIQISTATDFSTILRTIYVGDIDNYIIENLSASTQYYIRLYAMSHTEASNVSNIVSVTTSALLPSISLLDASEITDSTARLSWTINSAYSSYRLSIYKKIDLVNITQGRTNFLGDGFFNNFNVGNTSNYLVDLFLEPSSTYSYYITGETSNGDSKVSSIGEFSTKAKAPTIQISNNGKFLEWSGNLTRIEISTDAQFKTLLQGWHPRTVENTGSFDISAITTSDTCYYIRGYEVFNSIKGQYSNTVSTFGKEPILLPAQVTKTTALVKWKKNVANNYSVQLLVENAGDFIPVSGYTFPVTIGDTDFIYLKDLSEDTVYAIYLYWFDESTNRFKKVALPLYFKTNKYNNVTELTTSGTAPTVTSNSSYDRYTLTLPTTDKYLIEISRRSDFLTIDEYLEADGTTVEILGQPDTTYYLKVYKVNSSNKSNPASLTVTTQSLPSFGASLTTAPVLSSPTILNQTEAIMTFNSLVNATGYIVEVSETNTFNLLDKVSFVTFLDTTKVLISNLIGTKTYYVRVYGYNAHSISPYSNVVLLDTTP